MIKHASANTVYVCKRCVNGVFKRNTNRIQIKKNTNRIQKEYKYTL